jgi:hypothetical protein
VQHLACIESVAASSWKVLHQVLHRQLLPGVAGPLQHKAGLAWLVPHGRWVLLLRCAGAASQHPRAAADHAQRRHDAALRRDLLLGTGRAGAQGLFIEKRPAGWSRKLGGFSRRPWIGGRTVAGSWGLPQPYSSATHSATFLSFHKVSNCTTVHRVVERAALLCADVQAGAWLQCLAPLYLLPSGSVQSSCSHFQHLHLRAA